MKTASVAVVVMLAAGGLAAQAPGVVLKQRLGIDSAGPDLIQADAWRPWDQGFTREDGLIVCDNGAAVDVARGAGQTVILNQTAPRPIVATAWSRAEAVTGGRNVDYSLYLDLLYTDGEAQWGETAAFSTGSHDWERRQVLVVPNKPLRSVSLYVLLRNHGGKAWFRDVALREIRRPEGTATFDGLPVILTEALPEDGFQVCDQAAGDDIRGFTAGQAAGLRLNTRQTRRDGATLIEADLRDDTGRDRAVTLYYALRLADDAWRWLADPRTEEAVEPFQEYAFTSRFDVGGNGHLSRYPLAALASVSRGQALAIEPFSPAYARLGYSAASRELFLAWDLALTPERPAATIRLCRFEFDPAWGFRAALEHYYRLYPEAFRNRTPRQGLWMPFAKISQVPDWKDFGFVFKEGDNETAWDDAHGITTFRYTEPMTWWMTLPAETPRTLEAALAMARQAAREKPDSAPGRAARALLSSGFHDPAGRFEARFLDTPWCRGVVWSMNSMPDLEGDLTDFAVKWNPARREALYGPERKGDLDGEYVDSSEGYVTATLNYRRDHFAAARTPLVFDTDFRPAIFRGLIATEYVQALAEDVHGMGKLMMANSTPSRLWFLAPHLDVMGTETNWNHGGTWQPMAHRELLYRRALCGPKPFCFLMNTDFEAFSHDRVEAYMQRCLAYGMFPGFFSHNAAEGHYFTRPALYERDRPLFRRYMPLVRRVAEAGWQPLTLARTETPGVLVERFGEEYLTVFNDGPTEADAALRLMLPGVTSAADLVSGKAVPLRREGDQAVATLSLGSEKVAVLHLQRAAP